MSSHRLTPASVHGSRRLRRLPRSARRHVRPRTATASSGHPPEAAPSLRMNSSRERVRRGPAELWERFDEAVAELDRVSEGRSLRAVAHAYAELAEITRQLARSVEHEDRVGRNRAQVAYCLRRRVGAGSPPSATAPPSTRNVLPDPTGSSYVLRHITAHRPIKQRARVAHGRASVACRARFDPRGRRTRPTRDQRASTSVHSIWALGLARASSHKPTLTATKQSGQRQVASRHDRTAGQDPTRGPTG